MPDIIAGSTDKSVFVYFVDDDGGTAPGEPTTGLLFSDIETGGSASYARQGAARVDITLVTLASAAAAHTDGGFVEVDGTNMPGVYRLDLPDAALAVGVDLAIVHLVAAAAKNTLMRPLEIMLPTSTPQTGDSYARIGAAGAGLTATKLSATGLDAIASTATGMVEIAKAIWDRALTGATHNVPTSAGRRLRGLQDFGLYEGGAVWIDTVNGTAGTVDFENGTTGNPVDTIADALTIAASLNFRALQIVPGSAIVLAAALDDFFVAGHDYTVALGGQSVNNTFFFGASAVSGAFTGTPNFHNGIIGSITGPSANVHDSLLTGTILNNASGNWYFHHCASGQAGPTTPVFDFGTDVGSSTNATFGDYANGIEIRNYNNQGTDLLSLAGQGQVVYAASCSGEVQRRGEWKRTNLGTVTEVTDDNTTKIAAISGGATFDPTAAMTESYAANGIAPSMEQSLFAIHQRLMQFGIIGNDMTVRKLDDVTTAFVVHMNDDTLPTDSKRV